MLLTLKQPSYQTFRSVHEYSPPTPPSTARFSPAVTSADPSITFLAAEGKVLPPLPATSYHVSQLMSTPHRGLPPPAAMTLPQPAPGPPPIGQPPPLSQPLGQLPAPPQPWQGAEESMRHWLQAKAEEDKRKQEEEKTRQESLRLEQRKIEQDMLRTSLEGGIPPYLVPMVFAGMGGGNPKCELGVGATLHGSSASASAAAATPGSLTCATSGVPRVEERIPPHLSSFGTAAAASTTAVVFSNGRAGRCSTGFICPRLSTISDFKESIFASRTRPDPATSDTPSPAPQHRRDAHPTADVGIRASRHPGAFKSRTPAVTTNATRSSIFAVHLFSSLAAPAPQTGASGPNQPPTPSDPSSASPRKRKAQGSQQDAPPPPTSQPQYTSPPFSHGGSSAIGTPSSRRRGHSRQRSDLSTRALDSHGRPVSRHRHVESGTSTHSGVSSHAQGFESTATSISEETPARRRYSHRGSSPERSAPRLSQYYDHSYGESSAIRHDVEQRSPGRQVSARPSVKRSRTRD